MVKTTNALSIYIHIPFCTKKCPYCNFFVVQDNENLKDKLLTALISEIKRKDLSQKKVASIYLGGGTPSLFGPNRISKLIDLFYFTPEECEITLEANPENLSKELVKQYIDAGINRLSIGVQSFQNEELRLLGRNHTKERIITAIQEAFQSGIDNISIDLMYETPLQTLESFRSNLEQAAALPISHLSLYNLTFEEGTPFFRKEKELKKLIATNDDGTKMYELAIEVLEKNGLEQYEVSAFCRGGRRSLHNTGYWTGREFFGFGPSAFSCSSGCRYRNVAHFSRYINAIEQGVSAIDFEEPIARPIREFFVLGLRLKEGIHLLDFQSRFGVIDQETLKQIDTLMHNGFLYKNESRISLTRKGLFFYDDVASVLI